MKMTFTVYESNVGEVFSDMSGRGAACKGATHSMNSSLGTAISGSLAGGNFNP
jgi:hypothetical protein